MLKVDVLNMEGKKVGDIDLKEEIFGVEISTFAMHAALKNYLANQRQGTQSTKTRAEVRGGGKKPWRQKGTGRARQGSIRAPQWIKGGIALGPKPRTYRYEIPKKLKRLAIKSALTSKLQEGNLIIVDKLDLAEIKTKKAVEMLNKLKAQNAFILLGDKNKNVQASIKNIPTAKIALTNTINIFDLLKYNKLVLTQDSVKKLEEVYA